MRMTPISRALVTMLSAPIRAYRYAISPMLPPSCRFVPSCSEYALEALSRHGPLTGAWLAAVRVCRCNPWNAGGVDPVPAPRSGATGSTTGSTTRSLPRASDARWPAALRGEEPHAKAD